MIKFKYGDDYMTLQQLNYAITISQTGSMNRAAEQLYISQPSLTNSIKELEKELFSIKNHISERSELLSRLSL